MNLFILNHPLSQSGCRACVGFFCFFNYLLSHHRLSFCLCHLDLYNYVFIYIYIYILCIFIQSDIEAETCQTHADKAIEVRSQVAGRGRAGRQGERPREHGSTRLQFTTLLRSMQQEVRSSTLTQARHLETRWSGLSEADTRRY